MKNKDLWALESKDVSMPKLEISPEKASKFMLNNFHILLKAQIEIGNKTDKTEINKILNKYGIPGVK